MAKFNLDDYDPVEERIKKFYADHPEGRIITTLTSDPNNIDFSVFRAAVFVGGDEKATGWAVELRDKELSKGRRGEYESVNYSSWLENCETSAIGRALANAGYQGSKRPSRQEMQKVERMNNAATQKQETKEVKLSDNQKEFKRLIALVSPEKQKEYWADIKAETTPEGKQRVLTELQEFVKSIEKMPPEPDFDDTGLDDMFTDNKAEDI